MAEPFLGQIMMVGFNFAPRSWAECDGQILPINQNQSLYSLLGTTYGGDGRTSFALPDMRGRVPLHYGQGPGLTDRTLGEKPGEERHVLNLAEMPSHSHQARFSNAEGETDSPVNAVPAQSGDNLYHSATNLVSARSGTITNTGAGQSHENMQPFLVIKFCIALQGLFPPRN
jgi:microcystin-dependent protein